MYYVYLDQRGWQAGGDNTMQEHASNDFAREILLERLRLDQSEGGVHDGQFGRSAKLDAEKRYQSLDSDMSTKPRIYLTLWPAQILKKYDLLPSHTDRAQRGIERLFVDNRILMHGHAVPTRESKEISYRHTIGGALVLCVLGGWTLSIRSILGNMLDSRAHWQNSDGGWAQADKKHTESDLWGSAYAARLLSMASESGDLSDRERKLSNAALETTIDYFWKEWSRCHWSYEDAHSAENIPLVLIEIGPLLARSDPDLLADVVTHVSGWLMSESEVGEAYLAQCASDSKLSVYSRLAYALFRGGERPPAWLPLYKRALENIAEDSTSVDCAFLVDLTFEAEKLAA